MTDYTDEQLIAKHLEIKRHKEAREAAFNKEKAALNQMLQAIEGLLNARILAKGPQANSISTASGTVFQRVTTYCRVVDPEKLEKYVRETGDLSFIDWDVKREGVEKYIEQSGGHEPPGVTVTRLKQTITRE